MQATKSFRLGVNPCLPGTWGGGGGVLLLGFPWNVAAFIRGSAGADPSSSGHQQAATVRAKVVAGAGTAWTLYSILSSFLREH